MKPLFSIIIANYNYGRFLGEAISSILNQTCQDFELLVVDGGSTDNSVDIIRKYAKRLAWWCSEPDRGQSDAFNKGFSHASGRFLTWLNADDVFFPWALEKAQQTIIRHADCEWFVGGCFWLDPDLKVMKCSGARPFSRVRANRGEICVWAPSSFFSKSLLDKAGGLDVDFHYKMDTDLWFKFNRKVGAIYRPINCYCWGLRLHPDAKTSGHQFVTSDHVKATHPKWEKMQDEQNALTERYGKPHISRALRWLTTPPSIFLRNQFDSWRFRGKSYLACFPKTKELMGP